MAESKSVNTISNKRRQEQTTGETQKIAIGRQIQWALLAVEQTRDEQYVRLHVPKDEIHTTCVYILFYHCTVLYCNGVYCTVL